MKLSTFVAAIGMVTFVPAVALALDATVYHPVGGDSRGYDDGDWSVGYWKGQCQWDHNLQGVSTDFSTGMINGMLCAGPYGYYYASVDTISLTLGHDDRRDTSTGDWDYGYIKGECAYDQSISGISQDEYGIIHNARCDRTGYAVQTDTCVTLQFVSQDNRLSGTWGDWDYTYKKNQCADYQIVKGISIFGNGRLKSILCCAF